MSQGQYRRMRPQTANPAGGNPTPQMPAQAQRNRAQAELPPSSSSNISGRAGQDELRRQQQQQAPTQKNKDPNKNTDALLKVIERKLNAGRKVPFSEQCMVDKDEILYYISLIRESLPEELQQANWLLTQNRQLIAEARKEAANIMRDAEQQMAKMIDEHEITQQAQSEAHKLLDEASAQSRQIHSQAIEYAHRLLGELEEQLTEMLVFIQKNKKDIEVGT